MASMRTKYQAAVAAACAIVYLAAAGSAAFRLASHAKERRAAAEAEFSELVARVGAAAAFGFMDASFRDAVKDTVEASSSLAAAVVGGPDGPEYGVAREPGRLLLDGGSPRLAFGFDTGKETLFAPLVTEGVRNATLTASYVAFDRLRAFEILRDSLFAAILALAVCVLALALDSSGENPDPEAAVPRSAFASAPGPRTPEAAPLSEDYEIPDIDAAAAEPKGLFSPRTGLGWEAYAVDRLVSELHRCAASEQDLSYLVLAPREGGDDWDAAFPALAAAASEHFAFRDLAFERGRDGLCVVLPNQDLTSALRSSEDFLSKLAERADSLGEACEKASPRIGISARAGRLVDARRLAMEADRALSKAKEAGDARVVAFKPDPERYRAFVAAKN